MQHFLIFLVSIASGILGGMGMGGGTILIPALTLIFGLSQLFVQGANLIAFLGIGIVAVIIHAKNNLINFKVALFAGGLACLASVPLAFLAQKTSENVLKKILGVFLILIAILMLVRSVVALVKTKKRSS